MKITTNANFTNLVHGVYDLCGLKASNLILDRDSKEYEASSFQLNSLYIIARKAKITPKKIGQFVTLWKRNSNGVTAPYEESDKVDLFVINVLEAHHMGQFIFPKEVLIEKGIVSSANKEGKRGFRVYPPWSKPTNKTALKTQKWQLEYFLEIGHNSRTDIGKAKLLYLLR